MLQLEHNPNQDRYYVTLAYSYGLTVPEIVNESGIPVERVRSILGGA